MATDIVTRARIAALTAAEEAIEENPHDPFAELKRISATAASAVRADPDIVHRIAGEIVVRAFRADFDSPGSLEFLCVTCGAPLPENRPICSRCVTESLSDN